MSLAVLRRVADLELKVRHVRTTEGVRKYHLPIGSPIVARAKKVKTRKASNTPIARAIGGDSSESDYYKPTKQGVLWRKKVSLNYTDRGYIALGKHDSGVVGIKKAPGQPGYIPIYIRDGESPKLGPIYKTIPEAKSWVDRQIQMADAVENNKPHRITKEYDNFYDVYGGTYGWDWTWGDEDPKLIVDAQSDDREVSNRARRRLAARESKELGIKVIHEEGGPKVDVAAHENINAIVRAHVEQYPGLEYYIPIFALYKEHRVGDDALAWNSLKKTNYNADESWRGDGYTGPLHVQRQIPQMTKDGESRLYDHSEIGLGTKLFADGFDERGAKYLGNTDFWTTNLGDASQKHDIEQWRLAHMYTITHEIGHSVMWIANGTYESEDPKNPSWGGEFRNALTEILQRYDVVDKQFHPNTLGEPSQSSKAAQTSWNTKQLAQHISRYGASNIDELGAESWAAYWMSDEPTEMQVEIAQLMEHYLQRWLEQET